MTDLSKSLTCLRCGGAMERGFIVDHTHGGMAVGSWTAGEPQKSFWTGLKVKGPSYEVLAFRCAECGRLELFTEVEGDHLLRPAEGPGEEDASHLLRSSDIEA